MAARGAVEVHSVQSGKQVVQVQEDTIRPISGHACIHHLSSDLDGGCKRSILEYVDTEVRSREGVDG